MTWILLTRGVSVYVSLIVCHPYCVVVARDDMIGARPSHPESSAATAGDDCRGSFPPNPLTTRCQLAIFGYSFPPLTLHPQNYCVQVENSLNQHGTHLKANQTTFCSTRTLATFPACKTALAKVEWETTTAEAFEDPRIPYLSASYGGETVIFMHLPGD